MKVVIIGAGSDEFGVSTVLNVLTEPALQNRGVTLALVDTDSRRLGRVTLLAERLAERFESGVTIQAATDRRHAIPGADVVIVSVARDRFRLWELDYRIPAAFGIRQSLGENGGPGGVFHALRSLQLVVPIARDMEELSPRALMLSYTNPEPRVVHAVSTLTGIDAIGVCHSVHEGRHYAARALGTDLDSLEITSAGMNHLFALLRVEDRRTGVDRLSEVLEFAREGDPEAEPLFRSIARNFGYVTLPADDHTGEYFAWGTEYVDGGWPYGHEGRAGADVPQMRVDHQARLRLAVDGVLQAAKQGANALVDAVHDGPEDMAVPITAAIASDSGTRHPAVNVMNRDGYIANLPRNMVVEVPARVDAGGVHPETVGDIPEALASVLRTQGSIQALVTEAYASGSRTSALQALLLDPCVPSIAAAAGILDRLLRLEAEFLPELS